MAATSERATLTSVLDAIESNLPEIEQRPQYFSGGDHLVYVFVDDEWYTERVDDRLTVYRSKNTHEMIGCKIKGVSLLAENAKNIFQLEDGEVELRMILLSAVEHADDTKHFYYDLSAKCQHATIPIHSIFQAAA